MRTVLVFLFSLYCLVVPKFLCYVWDTFVVNQYLVPSISYKTMFALYITYRAIIKIKDADVNEIKKLRNIYNNSETSEDLKQEDDDCFASIYSILMHFTQLAIAYIVLMIIR